MNIKPYEQTGFTPKDGKVKQERYEHFDVLNQLLKAINVTPMDDELKMILRMRIWGVHPLVFDPMSQKRIKRHLNKYGWSVDKKEKCTLADVVRWEMDALYNVAQHLGSHKIQDIVDMFNKDKKQTEVFKNKSKILT